MTREEAETLLVFLANGTLEGEEKAAVEAAVARDAVLARDLAALKAMRATLKEGEPVQSPGEIGLARLMREIEDERAEPGLVAANSPAAPRLWKVAAVVLLGLVVAQSVYFGQTREPGMELASGEAAGVVAEHRLRVAFAGDASEAEIRALLQGQGLQIVAGPSALGLYTLAARDEVARAAALAALEARPDVIESVE